MKLYMVIYILHHIAGSIGPLPYDMKECQVRAAEMFSHVNKNVITPEGLTYKNVVLDCEMWADRPPEDTEWLERNIKGEPEAR